MNQEMQRIMETLMLIEFWPRKWPCFAVGFVSSGNEFVLHLYVICFRIRWGY